jgi:CubicO group peptidase (beta-lactamase class C family)
MSLLDNFPIFGTVAPGFEPVRAAFEANFTRRGEVGAAVHVLLDGQPVVDLWAGARDAASTRPWAADTLVNLWSTTKGWLALCLHLLAERGLLDFEAPVARYWPEFARHGKEGLLVRHLLTHTAGLPAPSVKVPDAALYDWQQMVRALEDSTLFWQPGAQTAYHAATFGWLNGEVLRRITGLSVGAFLRRELAGPLGADAWIGLPPSEFARTAETLPPSSEEQRLTRLAGVQAPLAAQLASSNPPRKLDEVNTARWRQAEIPSSNGHASARGVARLYLPLALGGSVNGMQFLSPASVARACREQVHEKDAFSGMPVRRTLGFALPDPEQGDPRPLTAVGHGGMGGSLGFADPAHRLAFGYAMNQLKLLDDQRAAELCRALYACLEG